ncbi:phosphoadenosine phosphosulfate reductase domain-containing protein [Actinoplanes sp. RD1]|uniref:phosphoadenosine phosphosulfate reductase domain-containing protein n=1 Tax=Actinoplanes sp. RD1 TaxID=3064538 RepID=UPI002740FE48|nr:phosphoadenosine phosphosulfate reductase family protein [Actinoplanes sp. RD1]
MIDLTRYDAILVQSSAGKDSAAQLDVIAHAAHAAGVLDRVTVFHAELPGVEWPGVVDLAATQAHHYGLRFAVRRQFRGLLDLIHQRGYFPAAHARFCTADQKRAVAGKYVTELLRGEFRHLDRPLRVLSALGLRAAESPTRARRPRLRTSTRNRAREVTEWLPIHDWTIDQVWNTVNATGIPRHWAYTAGMSRLSCSICPLASRRDLVLACQLRPQLARQYAALEDAIGHRIQNRTSMHQLIAQAAERP